MSLYVVDCNIWISALGWGGDPFRALEIIDAEHAIVISKDIYAEVIEVLSRPKFQPQLSAAAIERFEYFVRDAVWVVPTTAVWDCIDTDDNMYLECALEAQADSILTGDDHLLRLHPWRNIPIVTVKEILNEREQHAGLGL